MRGGHAWNRECGVGHAWNRECVSVMTGAESVSLSRGGQRVWISVMGSIETRICGFVMSVTEGVGLS